MILKAGLMSRWDDGEVFLFVGWWCPATDLAGVLLPQLEDACVQPGDWGCNSFQLGNLFSVY